MAILRTELVLNRSYLLFFSFAFALSLSKLSSDLGYIALLDARHYQLSDYQLSDTSLSLYVIRCKLS